MGAEGGDARMFADAMELFDGVDDALRKTLRSRRWTVGDKIVSALAKLLRRRSHPFEADRAVALLDRYRSMRPQLWAAVSADASATAWPTTNGDVPGAISVDLPHAVAPAGPGTYDVVVLANIGWRSRFQRPQQLALQFARAGHRVFYVVSDDVDSGRPYDAAEVAPGVWEVVLHIARALQLYARLPDHHQRTQLRSRLAALAQDFQMTDVVQQVHLPSWSPVALGMREDLGWTVLYDCMDEWQDFPGLGQAIVAAEAELAAQADLVVVTAGLLEKKWHDRGVNALLIRNGVDTEFFRAHTGPAGLLEGARRPVIGFFGGLAEWVDFALISHCARARPDWTFCLVGDVFVDDLAGLEALPNVVLTGLRPHADIPRYLFEFDVCTIPFTRNHITQAVDPVKLYEYLSAGKPVVATDLEELRVHGRLVYLAEDRDQYLARLDEAVAEDDPDLRAERVAAAALNDWRTRYEAMDAALRSLAGRLSVIVVTYNNRALNQRCLNSLLAGTTHPDVEIIVVDNASTDGTPALLQWFASRHDNVHVILNDENQGFAAANNQGLAQATGDWLVLLNNDTVVPSGWHRPLLDHLRHDDVGLVGPRSNNVGNEARIAVPYGSLEDMPAFAAKLRWSHRGRSFDIRMLAMFCVAMRRDVHDKIGPLDESYGIGMFEDDDYSFRVKAAGLRVICAEDAFVHHVGGASFKSLIDSGGYVQLWDRNKAMFERKWGRWAQ